MTRIERTSSQKRPLLNKTRRLIGRIEHAEEAVTRIVDDMETLEGLLGNHEGIPRTVKTHLTRATTQAQKFLDAYSEMATELSYWTHDLKELVEKEEAK